MWQAINHCKRLKKGGKNLILKQAATHSCITNVYQKNRCPSKSQVQHAQIKCVILLGKKRHLIVLLQCIVFILICYFNILVLNDALFHICPRFINKTCVCGRVFLAIQLLCYIVVCLMRIFMKYLKAQNVTSKCHMFHHWSNKYSLLIFQRFITIYLHVNAICA